jgi:hypothetical protein
MSEQTRTSSYIGREQLRIHFERLRQSRQRSALGMAEIAGLAGALILMVAAIFAYLSILVPARSRLAQAKVQQLQLEENNKKALEEFNLTSGKDKTVHDIAESLTNFEENTLAERSVGRLALYNSLNELIRSNNLRNTSGPNYFPLDALGEDGKPAGAASSRTGNAKLQSLYPGIGVSVTVEGQYSNLRRFIRDLEATHQFLVIDSVQLEQATSGVGPGETTAAAAASTEAPAAAAPSTKSSIVSLQLSLAAYFRQEPQAEPTVQTQQIQAR